MPKKNPFYSFSTTFKKSVLAALLALAVVAGNEFAEEESASKYVPDSTEGRAIIIIALTFLGKAARDYTKHRYTKR